MLIRSFTVLFDSLNIFNLIHLIHISKQLLFAKINSLPSTKGVSRTQRSDYDLLYRISSFKHRGVYLILKLFGAAFIRGGIYLKNQNRRR